MSEVTAVNDCLKYCQFLPVMLPTFMHQQAAAAAAAASGSSGR